MKPVAVSVLCGSFLLAPVLAIPVVAQTTCVRGMVTNSSGQPIAEAHITLMSSGDSKERTAVSGAEGKFEVCGVVVGQYMATAAAPGLSSEEQTITVAVGRMQSLDLTLLDKPNAESQGTGVGEFRYSAQGPSDLPDSPAAAGDRKRPHGEVKAMWGSGLAGRRGLTISENFSLAGLSAEVGGDMGSERMSYFARAESIGVDSLTLLDALAAAQERAQKSILIVPTMVTGSSVEGRLDRRFNQRDSSYLRFNRDSINVSSVLPTGKGMPVRIAESGRVTQTSITAGNMFGVSPTTVNESRASFVETDSALPPGAQQVNVIANLPTERHDRVFQAASNIYRQVGGESLKFGGDFLLSQMSLTFIETAAQSTMRQSGKSTGAYIVSERQLGPNLKLTAGARYELSPVKGFKTDHDRMAPQVGFAWSPGSRTVLRGGGGIYYDQVGAIAIAGAGDKGGIGNLENSVSLSGALPPGTLLMTENPMVRRSYVETANFGVEQQLSAHTTFSADYQFARGLEVETPVYQSTRMCSSGYACRQNQAIRALEAGSGAQSNYHGFTAVFAQEPVHWGNYSVSYTYASSESSGFLGNETELNDLLRQVSLKGVLHTSAEPASGAWQHLTRGFVLSGGGDFSNRSEFTGINFLNVDARLTKTLAWGQHYRLDALAESMNSFERTSTPLLKSMSDMGDRFASVYSTFRAVAALQGPTATQVGLRLGF